MEIFIDDNRVEKAFHIEGTVADALRHVQTALCSPDRKVVGLRCDGIEILSAQMTAALEKPADSCDRLEIFTGTPGTLVADALAQAAQALRQTEEERHHIAQLLTEGKTSQGIEALGQCINVWQQVHDAIVKSIQMLELDLENETIKGDPIQEVLSIPKDALLQIKDALVAQDHVLLADVLEYEFDDATEKWFAIIDKLRQDAEQHSTATG